MQVQVHPFKYKYSYLYFVYLYLSYLWYQNEGEGVSLWTEGIVPKWGWERLFVNVENWKLKVEISIEAKVESWKLKIEILIEFNFQIGHYCKNRTILLA